MIAVNKRRVVAVADLGKEDHKIITVLLLRTWFKVSYHNVQICLEIIMELLTKGRKQKRSYRTGRD